MIFLFILIAILLPQLRLPPAAAQVCAIVLLVLALVVFVVWPDLDLRVRNVP